MSLNFWTKKMPVPSAPLLGFTMKVLSLHFVMNAYKDD